MPFKAKLYLNFLDFGFLVHFLLQGLTWAALGLWTQNHPQVVGTCPGHGPQPIAQNILSKSFGPEPPSLSAPYVLAYSLVTLDAIIFFHNYI